MVFLLNSLVDENVRYYCSKKGEKDIFMNMLSDSTIVVHALEPGRGTLFVINSTEATFSTLIHEISTILRCGMYSDCIFFEHFLLADYRSLQGILALRKNHKITARQCEDADLNIWNKIQKREKRGQIQIIMSEEVQRLAIKVDDYLYFEEPIIHKTEPLSVTNPNLHKESTSLPIKSNFATKISNTPKLDFSKKIEPNPPSSSRNKNCVNHVSLDESIFTQCSICHQNSHMEDLLHILSCGHVLCVSCVHPALNYVGAESFANNICPICGPMEPCFIFPSMNVNNTANCALHKTNQAKFYCEECVRFLCSEKECKGHTVVKIEEISMENSILANELASAGTYIDEMTNVKSAAMTSLSKLNDKSHEIRNKFQSIIDAAFERMREVEEAIESEKTQIAKQVLEVSKKVEGAQRRIRLALHIYKITRNYFWTSNIMMLKVYRLGATNVFRKALEMSKNAKNTSQRLQKFRLDFENDDLVNIIVEQLRNLFKKYTVSDGVNSKNHEVPSQTFDPHEQASSSCISSDPMPKLFIEPRNFKSESSERSKAVRESLFSSQKTVSCTAVRFKRPEPQFIPPDRRGTSNEMTDLVPRKRPRTVPCSSYSSMLSPVVNDCDNLMDAFVNTTYKQEPFTLLTPASKNLVVQEVKNMCREEKNRRNNMKNGGVDEKSIVGKQRIRINRLVLQLYSKQDRGELEDIKQEVIKIEPPNILDKEIKKEEFLETSQIG